MLTLSGHQLLPCPGPRSPQITQAVASPLRTQGLRWTRLTLPTCPDPQHSPAPRVPLAPLRPPQHIQQHHLSPDRRPSEAPLLGLNLCYVSPGGEPSLP